MEYTLPWADNEHPTGVVIDTDYITIGRPNLCKYMYNYYI
jgi:hypothetical protein